MHFCEVTARPFGKNCFSGPFGAACPRKIGLYWFMPAFANSSVGSLCGTTGLDGHCVCAFFWMKKSMNVWRTRVPLHSGFSPR